MADPGAATDGDHAPWPGRRDGVGAPDSSVQRCLCRSDPTCRTCVAPGEPDGLEGALSKKAWQRQIQHLISSSPTSCHVPTDARGVGSVQPRGRVRWHVLVESTRDQLATISGNQAVRGRRSLVVAAGNPHLSPICRLLLDHRKSETQWTKQDTDHQD